MAECFHLKYLCFPMSGRQCLKLESRACIGSRLKTSGAREAVNSAVKRVRTSCCEG